MASLICIFCMFVDGMMHVYFVVKSPRALLHSPANDFSTQCIRIHSVYPLEHSRFNIIIVVVVKNVLCVEKKKKVDMASFTEACLNSTRERGRQSFGSPYI